MKPTRSTHLPASVKTAQSVYHALSILQKRGFADVNFDVIEKYKDTADKTQLDQLLRDAQTVEEFVDRIAHLGSDFQGAVRPEGHTGVPIAPTCVKRPVFVQPIATFVGVSTREREIHALELLLRKRTKNNVLLCGAAGSGKTALVEALATLRPDLGPFWRVDVGVLVSGTKHRGDLEQRLTELFDFATISRSIIFIDEIHALAQMGVAEGSVNVLDVMKPYLVHPSFRVIGATTLDEVRFIIADTAFHRRFSVLRLPELTVGQLQVIFDGYIAESTILAPFKDSFTSIMSFIEGLTIPASRVDALLDFLEHVEAFLTLRAHASEGAEDLLQAAGTSFIEFQFLPENNGMEPIGGEK